MVLYLVKLAVCAALSFVTGDPCDLSRRFLPVTNATTIVVSLYSPVSIPSVPTQLSLDLGVRFIPPSVGGEGKQVSCSIEALVEWRRKGEWIPIVSMPLIPSMCARTTARKELVD